MTNKLYKADPFILIIHYPYIDLIVHMKQYTNTVVVARFLVHVCQCVTGENTSDDEEPLAKRAKV